MGIAIALAGIFAIATADPSQDRFFVMGGGTLAIRNAHTGERAEIRYRREDGSYDPAALAVVRRLFRSRSDQAERDISLRLVEILSMIQIRARVPELVLVSGYRSPALNEKLRGEGRQAAGGSLHTEAIAADLRIAGTKLRPLWIELRALECCGVGLYEDEGFLHVDVGRPRFWEPATSRVGENLSADNARVFARTEYDRYVRSEPIELRVYAITAGPIAIGREARLVADDGDASSLTVAPIDEVAARSEPANGIRCIEVGPSQRLVARGAAATSRARIELRTCDPRAGQSPATIDSNAIEVR